jgi:hypothetical protein
MSLAESDRSAETVPCTMCEAPAGTGCVSAFNRERIRAFPHSVRLIAAAKAGMSLAESDRFAETVPCTMCEAPAGTGCVSVFNPEHLRGLPHSVRLIAAAEAGRK